jgi:hypothetical protein
MPRAPVGAKKGNNNNNSSFLGGYEYLTSFSVSRPYSVSDGMIKEYTVGSGLIIGRRNRSIQIKPTSVPLMLL